MKRSAYPRTSLGPEYIDMLCFACGNDGAHACIDRNGAPYVSCRYCKARSLSLHLRAVASLKFLTDMLRDETVRRAWAKSCAEAEVRRWTAPDREQVSRPVVEPVPLPVPSPRPEEVSRG